MVVCFVGFQGIVPQSWESAAALSPAGQRESNALLQGEDSRPTGIVGPSLLAPPDSLDATRLPAANAPKAGAAAGGPGAAVDAAPKRPAEGDLFAPLDGLTPTSSFGFRTSPITGEAGEFHTGQDYAAPCGTPVYAADSGTVRAVGWHQWGGGNRVEVDHGNGLITSYNHLQGISVVAGDTVKGGDPIAEVGTTGSSTGCHLHFETILHGEHVDPLRWKLVPTEHGVRKGELRDYTPGGSGAADLPAWARSSTRSDQHVPARATDPFAEVFGGSDVGSDAHGKPSDPVPPTPQRGSSSGPGSLTSPAPPAVTSPEKAPSGGPEGGTSPDKTPDATTPGGTSPGKTPGATPGKTPDVTNPGGTPGATTPGATPGGTSSGKTPDVTSPGETPEATTPGGPEGVTPPDTTPGATPPSGTPNPTPPVTIDPAPTDPLVDPTDPNPDTSCDTDLLPTDPATPDPATPDPATPDPVTTDPVTTDSAAQSSADALPASSTSAAESVPQPNTPAPAAEPALGTEPAAGTDPAPGTDPVPETQPSPGTEPAVGEDADPTCSDPGVPSEPAQGNDPAATPVPATGEEPAVTAPSQPTEDAVAATREQG